MRTLLQCPKCSGFLDSRTSLVPAEAVQLDCAHCDIHAIGRDQVHALQRLGAAYELPQEQIGSDLQDTLQN